MMRIFYALLFTLTIVTPIAAQDAERETVQSTVTSQIEAFLRDDFAAAFTFASPGIRQFFGNSENFGAMVRQGFPMVWRPSTFRFLDAEEHGGTVLQSVLIRDEAGAYHVLEYQMLPGPDGWRINGVRILEQPSIGA